MPPAPARTGERVPIVNASAFVPFAFSWQVRPQASSLVVAVKATFDIDTNGNVAISAEQLAPSGDVRYDDSESASLRYPSDFVVRKPKADVTLVGHAYSSQNPAVSTVTLQVGGLKRTVAVFGDRSWGSFGGQSQPAPFQKMSLRWENAMGGALSEANPVGRGFKTGVLLPNLERPDALIRLARDVPAPAGLGPIAPEWKQRMGKLGSFNARWVRERWPYFPEDFDYAYFNAAPAEQQYEGLRGDEPFSLSGVHPKHAVIKGRLPGSAPRVYAHLFAEDGRAFVEVPVQLDTLWIDAENLKLVLVWRGLVTVRDEEASDIAALFVASTEVGQSLGLDEARQRYFREGQELGFFATPAAAASVAATDSGERRAALAPVVVDERPAGPAWLKVTEGQKPGPKPVLFRLPRVLAAPAAAVVTRDEVLVAVASGASLALRDFTGADLSDCDFSGRCMAGVILAGANLQRARFDGADLTEAVLSGVHAEESSFCDATLTQADLQQACLEGATFARAALGSANFEGARASHAVFSDAKAAEAVFAHAALSDALFERAELRAADFTQSSISRTRFDGACLDSARFYGATGERCGFGETSLLSARMDDCRILESNFASAKAVDSTWQGAVLVNGTFQRSVLEQANFSRAKLSGALLNAVEAKGVCFRKTVLSGASLLKANLMHASFEAADLENADLRGANLFGAETWRANLRGARLELALIAGTKLAT